MKEDNKSVNTIYDEKLTELKIAVNEKKVIKGMKEVIRAMNRNKVKTLYVALNDTIGGDYSKTLIEIAKQKNINKIIKIDDYVILRDIVLNGSISSIDNLRNKINKGPKCFCAAELI